MYQYLNCIVCKGMSERNGKIRVFHLGPKHFVIIHSHIQFANPVTWRHLDGHFLNRYGY